MFYVHDLKDDLYGIKDSVDGVVEYISFNQCNEYINSGIFIKGFLITPNTCKFIKCITDDEVDGHVGELYTNKHGLVCIITECEKINSDEDFSKYKVKFEDDFETSYCFRSLCSGHFRTKNRCDIGSSHVGEKNLMNCGLYAEVIKWYGCDGLITGSKAIHCRIRFSDDCEKDCSYYKFLEGAVNHPHYLRNELDYVGSVLKMNNGQTAEIVEYYGGHLSKCKIRFEDGYERECNLRDFKDGSVKNPTINDNRSLPERIVAYYISQHFDCITSYRPDWLRLPSGRNGEVDIWIPSLKVAIEYDGSGSHKFHTDKDNIKNELVLKTKECNRLIRLRELGLPDLISNEKVISLDANKIIDVNKYIGLEELENLISNTLMILGVDIKVEITNEIINTCRLWKSL